MSRGTDISEFKRVYRERNEGDFPKKITVELKKEWDLKYGENPAQHGAIYIINRISGNFVGSLAELTNIKNVRSDSGGKGGLSLTNTMDITRAMHVLSFFKDSPAVAIMKHNIVSGFAKQTNLKQRVEDLFRLARDADIKSNFGGTVVFNRILDIETARALYELKGKNPFFVDVLAALGYEENVIGYVEKQSNNVRIAEFSELEKIPRYQGDETFGLLSFKDMPTGRIGIQDLYLTSIDNPSKFILDPMVIDKDIKHVVKRDPTNKELEDLLTAWHINVAGARSNGVVFVKNGVSVAIGSGQVERVGAVEQAIIKGMQKAMDREGIEYNPLMGIIGFGNLSQNPFENTVCSSDAFFPFRDSVNIIASVGVTAVAQPYGSINDAAVIDAVNEYNMAAPATLERCFGHF